jgi:hypothetical protein
MTTHNDLFEASTALSAQHDQIEGEKSHDSTS